MESQRSPNRRSLLIETLGARSAAAVLTLLMANQWGAVVECTPHFIEKLFYRLRDTSPASLTRIHCSQNQPDPLWGTVVNGPPKFACTGHCTTLKADLLRSPLQVCLPVVVKEFCAQAAAFDLLDCSDVLQRNERSEGRPGAVRHNKLDMFFPFDPYLLPASLK